MTRSIKTLAPYLLVGCTLFGILTACIVQQNPTSTTGRMLHLEPASLGHEQGDSSFNNNALNDPCPEGQSEPSIAPVQAAPPPISAAPTPPMPSQPTRGDRLDEMLLNQLQSRASDQPLSPQEIESIIRQIEMAEE